MTSPEPTPSNLTPGEEQAHGLTSEQIAIFAVAILGLIGGAILAYIRLQPIVTAIFLAMAVASFVHGFLGGAKGATFVLGALKLSGAAAVLVGVTWFIDNRLQIQTVMPDRLIAGEVRDLIDQPVQPAAPAEPAMVHQQVSPEGHGVTFYTTRETDISAGKSDLGWVVRPQTGTRVVTFDFQHKYSTWALDDVQGPSFGDPPSTRQRGRDGNWYRRKDEVLNQEFVVDLDAIEGSPDSLVLRYEPHEANPETELGGVWLMTEDGGRRELGWAAGGAGHVAESHAERSGPRVLLVSSELPGFQRGEVLKADGAYDTRLGRALRAQLASPDLKSQLSAMELLVDAGPRALKFIEESLGDSLTEANYDRSMLVHNLATVTDRLAAAGTQVGDTLYLALAEAFYGFGDLESAATYYAQVPPGADPNIEFRRASALVTAAQYEGALQAYETILEEPSLPESARSAVHFNMAHVHAQLEQPEDAIQQYEEAIALDPDAPDSYNNLAYLLAEREDADEEDLTKALDLINKALEVLPDNPSYMDTRGWILFKLGRTEEALEDLMKAAELAPNDPEIKAHLAAARGIG